VCLYKDSVSFSARELAALKGRAWAGKTSEELHQAIMQLLRTGITASLYDIIPDLRNGRLPPEVPVGRP
jgi:hypothetical protein